MNNELQEHHVMILENTHPSGAEEWYCPTCGRRILMQWPPNYKKITLEEGDEYAIHSGGKGGVSMGVQIVHNNETDLANETDEDDPGLIQWEKWLKKINFENWWETDS